MVALYPQLLLTVVRGPFHHFVANNPHFLRVDISDTTYSDIATFSIVLVGET